VDQRVERVLRLMREGLHEELSLADLAQSVNLSVWRLSHIFRSEVGMPPIQYLKVLRIERAKQLLETSFLSVKEITHIIGLNDESHFVRDFKKTYGVPPTLYRTAFNRKHLNESEDAGQAQSKASASKARAAKHCLLLSLNVLNCLAQFL
jgi:transcriptional regulator GlxA family with amidase domain